MGPQRTDTPTPTPAGTGWGPEVVTRARPRWPRRLLSALLVLTLVLTLVLPVVAWARLTRIPVPGLATSGSPTHVLIIGSDSREGLTPEEERELSVGSGDVFTGERTDTILVLTVDRGRAAMLSFPRDLWVERCDGSRGRINVATSIDGPGCLATTVRDVSGIHVQHVVRVTFGGFRDVVDAVGGVELCLEDPIADRDAGIDLPAGCQVLDGTDSLGYVRVRKIDDDLQRIQRQQRFVQALARELTNPAVLLNPVALWELSGAMGGAITVDDRLGPIDLVRLAWSGRAIGRGEVASHTVPVVPRTTSGGAMVVEVQQPDAEALFARFRSGAVLSEATAGTGEAAPPPEPADIPVSVANGAGVSGLAGRIADDLAARGYPIVAVTNAAPTATTLVRHPIGAQTSAARVAADLPGPTALEATSEVDHVTVILSSDAAS